MWQDLFLPWLLFFSKLGSFFFLLAVFFAFFIFLLGQLKSAKKADRLRLHSWKKDLLHWQADFYAEIGRPKAFKKVIKQLKVQSKPKKNQPDEPILYVLNFRGDLKASAVENLKREVSFLQLILQPQDLVFIKVQSLGGTVIGYGQAAAELLRIKGKAQIISAIDQVAASGGYMLACVADMVLAAPFAIVGSIGVVAELPNFNRLLKKNEIDYKVYTAGKYKRTVGLFGEITLEGEDKFKAELELTHQYFKELVSKNRPQVKVDEIATGEVWYGQQAISLGLVDAISTSEDFLVRKMDDYKVIELHFEPHYSIVQRLGKISSAVFENGGLGKMRDRGYGPLLEGDWRTHLVLKPKLDSHQAYAQE